MTPQKQKYKHNPEIGQYGDCDRTTIACILDIPRDDVPNWAEKYWPTKDTITWVKERSKWLESRGYAFATTLYNNCTVEELLKYVGLYNKGVYWLLTGMSKNMTNHVVICNGDEIVWDTSLDDSGIIGPTNDGYFYVEFIIPKFCLNKN